MSESKLMFVLWDERTGAELGRALTRALGAGLVAAGVRRSGAPDVVLAPVTRDAPPVHAIVEEMTDGGDTDPGRRVTRLVESVATIGADRELDLVPTRRCALDLPGRPDCDDR